MHPHQMNPDLISTEDGKMRCAWCAGDPLYMEYHDREWGKLAKDDSTQFEFIVLESAQAGLSWITILKRRENYRKVFAGFNPQIIAEWNQADVERLLSDERIIRNRRKIEAAIHNARSFLEISSVHGSFSNWLMLFFDGKPLINHWDSLRQIPASTALSKTIARELKVKGFSFFGPVITYAHLQATGFINDHLEKCWCRTRLP